VVGQTAKAPLPLASVTVGLILFYELYITCTCRLVLFRFSSCSSAYLLYWLGVLEFGFQELALALLCVDRFVRICSFEVSARVQ